MQLDTKHGTIILSKYNKTITDGVEYTIILIQ